MKNRVIKNEYFDLMQDFLKDRIINSKTNKDKYLLDLMKENVLELDARRSECKNGSIKK